MPRGLLLFIYFFVFPSEVLFCCSHDVFFVPVAFFRAAAGLRQLHGRKRGDKGNIAAAKTSELRSAACSAKIHVKHSFFINLR